MGILYYQKDPKEELVILGMEQKMVRILQRAWEGLSSMPQKPTAWKANHT